LYERRSNTADAIFFSNAGKNGIVLARLSEEQVAAVLDKYTVGKVAFTMKGYKSIVPDLTAEEEAKILGLLKLAHVLVHLLLGVERGSVNSL